MSFRHSNAVREIDSGLFGSATERYVMIETAQLAEASGLVRYSQTELASIMLLSRLTVINEFKKLEKKGLLIKRKYGQYKVTVLPQSESATIKLTKQAREVAPVEVEEDLPELEEWEEYWEDNAKIDQGKIECLPIPHDEIPGFILEAERQGKLKRRPHFEFNKTDNRIGYIVYELAKDSELQ